MWSDAYTHIHPRFQKMMYYCIFAFCGLDHFHFHVQASQVLSRVHLTLALNSIADETALILIRHGESLWNAKNLFTGCVDVPLTKKGVEEAIEAGKRISNIPVDMIYTSALIRAQMTAMLAMTQHRRKKVTL